MDGINTKKGNSTKNHDGYLFTFDKLIDNDQQKAWRCEKKNTNKCKARIWTDLNNNVLDFEKNRNVIHSHEANPADVIAKQKITALKRRAQETMEPPGLLRSNILENVPSPVLSVFPTTNATKKVYIVF
jgi:hypothetical protein